MARQFAWFAEFTESTNRWCTENYFWSVVGMASNAARVCFNVKELAAVEHNEQQNSMNF